MIWRRAGRNDFWIGGLWAATSLAFVWLGTAGAGRIPSFGACGFKQVTGVACPSCGGSRAALSMADGHLAEALAMNPLFVAGLLLAAAAGLMAPIWVAARGPVPARLDTIPAPWRVAAGLAFLANWVYLVAAGV